MTTTTLEAPQMAKKKNARPDLGIERRKPFSQQEIRSEAAALSAMATALKKIADRMQETQTAVIKVLGPKNLERGRKQIQKFIGNAVGELPA